MSAVIPPDTRDIVRRVEAFNAGRDPKRLRRKYRLMRSDPFVFFRASAHLFWEDWAASGTHLNDAPVAWACGDLHLENFGSFHGDNGLVYFDLNDFDDAALAPATADLTRLLTSLHLAARVVQLPESDAAGLSRGLLDAYAEAIVDGKARWVERATSKGMVRELLVRARERSQRALLEARTKLKRRHRRIRLDGSHAIALPRRERALVGDAVQEIAESIGHHRREEAFFEVLDAAVRIAGTASLGVRRYVVLVRGHGGTDGNRLLDLKQVGRSSLAMHIAIEQPRWRNDADRVGSVQRRMQAVSPALLASVSFDRAHFLLRELQPSEDRLALVGWNHKLGRLRNAVVTMGQLLAWAQLRSASRQGAAGIDELISFGRTRAWRRSAVDYARAYATTAELDWKAFADPLGVAPIQKV